MFLKNIFPARLPGPDSESYQARMLKPAVTELFQDILNSGSSLRVKVTGRSMSPLLKGGEILTIKKVPHLSLRKGDLVFFKDNLGHPVIHRCIKKRTSKDDIIFQTKGDALLRPDKPIHHNQVLGKVFMMERAPLNSGSAPIHMESPGWIIMNYLTAAVNSIKSRIYCSLSTI
jgi:signal peptidase I